MAVKSHICCKQPWAAVGSLNGLLTYFTAVEPKESDDRRFIVTKMNCEKADLSTPALEELKRLFKTRYKLRLVNTSPPEKLLGKLAMPWNQ